MLIPEYYDQWDDRMEDYLNGIDEDLWKCITDGSCLAVLLREVGTASSNTNVGQQTEKHMKNKKRCLCELRGALPTLVYNYVHCCKTSKKIWDTLKDKYQREWEDEEEIC